VQEFQKGYMYKDSVVRHSMVQVANWAYSLEEAGQVQTGSRKSAPGTDIQPEGSLADPSRVRKKALGSYAEYVITAKAFI